MFLNVCKQTFHTSHARKSKRCFNAKSSTYYFHLKTKMLADFHICISVPFSVAFFILFKGLSIKQITQFFGRWEPDFKWDCCSNFIVSLEPTQLNNNLVLLLLILIMCLLTQQNICLFKSLSGTLEKGVEYVQS